MCVTDSSDRSRSLYLSSALAPAVPPTPSTARNPPSLPQSMFSEPSVTTPPQYTAPALAIGSPDGHCSPCSLSQHFRRHSLSFGNYPLPPIATHIDGTVPLPPTTTPVAGTVPLPPTATHVARTVPLPPTATHVARTVPLPPTMTHAAGTVPLPPTSSYEMVSTSKQKVSQPKKWLIDEEITQILCDSDSENDLVNTSDEDVDFSDDYDSESVQLAEYVSNNKIERPSERKSVSLNRPRSHHHIYTCNFIQITSRCLRFAYLLLVIVGHDHPRGSLGITIFNLYHTLWEGRLSVKEAASAESCMSDEHRERVQPKKYLLQTINLIVSTWQQVTQSTIQDCFLKCGPAKKDEGVGKCNLLEGGQDGDEGDSEADPKPVLIFMEVVHVFETKRAYVPDENEESKGIDETIIIKQLPVKHRNRHHEISAWLVAFISMVTKSLSSAREGCIGILRDYSDRSTLGHLIANAPIKDSEGAISLVLPDLSVKQRVWNGANSASLGQLRSYLNKEAGLRSIKLRLKMSGEPNTSLNLATNEDQIRLLLLEGDVSDIEIDLEEDEGEEIIFSNKSNDESEQPENIQAVGLTIELDTAYDEDLDDVPLSERLSYATRRPSVLVPEYDLQFDYKLPRLLTLIVPTPMTVFAAYDRCWHILSSTSQVQPLVSELALFLRTSLPTIETALSNNIPLPVNTNRGAGVYHYIASPLHRMSITSRFGNKYIASPLHRMSITSRFGNKYIAGPSHLIPPTSLYPANPTLTYNQ
uniref:Uncharacterized protein n=1 Tax=Timema douglasi TaxID=61478 RepID=A0A7R8VMG9_TIMDO|nr:unnamed protein product [Timema douglasi]